MEKIMSKTIDSSKLRIEDGKAFTLDLGDANTFTVRELWDDELGHVSGGSIRRLPGLNKYSNIQLKGS
jgi:hypothetical protein